MVGGVRTPVIVGYGCMLVRGIACFCELSAHFRVLASRPPFGGCARQRVLSQVVGRRTGIASASRLYLGRCQV